MNNCELPPHWERKKLADVVKPRREKKDPQSVGDLLFVGMEHVEAHSMRLLGSVPAKAMKSSAAAFRRDDIIYGRLRPYLNKVCKPGFDGLCSSEFIVLPDQPQLRSSYLQYRLNSTDFTRFASSLNAGDRPRVDFEQIGEFEIELPQEKEQLQIVAKIEELFSDLDAGVAALERTRAKLKRYRASVLKAAVEGRLTEKWRAEQKAKGVAVEPAAKLLERILAERRKKWEAAQLKKFADAGKAAPKGWQSKYSGPAEPVADNLSQIPEGWYWASLSQIGFLDRGRSKHRPRNASHLLGGPYPFIQTGDIRHANGVLRDFGQTYSEAGLAQSKLWPKGTLCITIAANIAETAILDFDACFPDSVVGFLPGSDLINVHFVELYIRTLQSRLEKMAPATAQKNMNLETLVRVPVCAPTYNEQVEIVSQVDAALSSITHAETEIERSLARAARLRQAILKRAFEGRLV